MKKANCVTFAAACLLAVAAPASFAQQIPITIGNTSGSISPPSNAADGNPGTSWNSGGPATQWIDIDLQQDRPVGRIRMLPEQFPAGVTRHNIYGRNTSGQWFDFGYVNSYTSDSQWIEHQITQQSVPVRYLIIQTTQSPSWIAWREFEVFAPSGPLLQESCSFEVPGSGWLTIKAEYRLGACPQYTKNPPYPNLYTHQYIANLPSGSSLYACQLPPAGWTVLSQDYSSLCGYIAWPHTNRFFIQKN
ncbi:discoidin domain-containing protein [Stigmatella erecta]|uniref:F5/8 type C domain-containing protein n=1 Tax=Stigmatella erecta TaxID=83460 RepID=A0A1I0L973_9BACT|nr:discoidin domain-containing protein [Stigmatella erecta]SEU36205.1 F5/8 type C domain-containing protein [Stigmatella erecta]